MKTNVIILIFLSVIFSITSCENKSKKDNQTLTNKKQMTAENIL